MAAKAWTDPHLIATIPVDGTGKQITSIVNKQLIFLMQACFPFFIDIIAILMVTRTLTRSLAFLVSFSEIQKKCSESSLAELILLKTYLIVSWSWTIILDFDVQKLNQCPFLLFQHLDSWVVDTVLPDLLGIIIIPHITIPPINTTTLPPTP